MENKETEKKRERIMEHENRLRELSDFINHNNIRIIGVPGKEERENGAENLFQEIVAETSLIWGRKQISRSRRHRELPSKSTKATNTKTYCN